MAKVKKSTKVPSALEAKYQSIVQLTDAFAREKLNEEYGELIQYATAAMCRKRPPPVARGKEAGWACGIAHAIGTVNFLFDPKQNPHVTLGELCEWFGVSKGTLHAKSKTVQEALGTYQLDPDWSLASLIEKNPLVWLIEVNGFQIDVRNAPRAIQEEAFRRGLIPYIPGEGLPHKEDNQQATVETTPPQAETLYTIEVHLFSGPMTKGFADKNPEVARFIEIRGDQTLQDLHNAIFDAFDREDPHLYEFQVGGKGPNDLDAKRFGPPEDVDTGDASQTTLSSLGLSMGEAFGYLFDFGDEWWHAVGVASIDQPIARNNYPKLVERIGASPPQYPEMEPEPVNTMEPPSPSKTGKFITFQLGWPQLYLQEAEDKDIQWRRVMEIDEGSTLEELHACIQNAIGFDNDHLYGFYVANSPRSQNKHWYDDRNDALGMPVIDLFPLPSGKKLFYLFDFGDNWLFQLAKSRHKPKPMKKGVEYPRVSEAYGPNPNQYPEQEEFDF